MTRGRFLALWTAGICVATLGLVSLISRASSAQSMSTDEASLASADFTIPPADKPCILPGKKLNLQCIIANDPDAKRIRAEEAALEAQALAAAQSGTLDPYHQVQTLGKLEIFDPNLSVNNNVACSYCHDPATGYGQGRIDLERIHWGLQPGVGPHHRPRCVPQQSNRQTEPTELRLRNLLPPTPIQPKPGRLLRRQLLGCARYGIQVAEFVG